MKHPKSCLMVVAVLAMAAFPAAAEEGNYVMPMDGRAPAENFPGRGTLNKVDAEAGKVNLSYAPIPSLGWKAKTADFEVQDRALLTSLKKGQKVAFKLVRARNGEYAISEISTLK